MDPWTSTPELYFGEALLYVKRHGRSRNKELSADFVIAVNTIEKYSCYVIVWRSYTQFIEFIQPLNMADGRDEWMNALWGCDDTLQGHVLKKKTAMKRERQMHNPLETKTDLCDHKHKPVTLKRIHTICTRQVLTGFTVHLLHCYDDLWCRRQLQPSCRNLPPL